MSYISLLLQMYVILKKTFWKHNLKSCFPQKPDVNMGTDNSVSWLDLSLFLLELPK
jgi:hypothetical protein